MSLALLYYPSDLTKWVILQALKGCCTLRTSNKGKKPKPKILKTVGLTDKLIKEYLLLYNMAW